MANSFDLSVNVRNANPSANIDYYYGTYNSLEEACQNVPQEVRLKGKTVGIIENGNVVEYWWKSGVRDEDLVIKFGINATNENNYIGTFTNIENTNSIVIAKSVHQKGNKPIVQCYLNNELALFNVSNSNGDITISWTNNYVTSNDVINVCIVKTDCSFTYDGHGVVNELNYALNAHNCGENPIVQCWLGNTLEYCLFDISNNNGDITISWNNDIDFSNKQLCVIFTNNTYVSTFTNANNDNSLTITANTHNKGNNPIVQCFVGDTLALLDTRNNNGNITISWNNSTDINALNPLKVIITDNVAESVTYDINDLVVIGEKNVGDGGITTTKNVGGVNSGIFLEKNTLLNKLLRDILSPTLNPTITAPSATMNVDLQNKLFEVGTITQATFTINFNRGSINPQYTSESPYSSGVALSYQLDYGEAYEINVIQKEIKLLDENDNPTEGFVNCIGTVNYAQGVQPKNSNGENYSTPLSEGSVNSNTISFEFVYPIYANKDSILTVDGKYLVSTNKNFIELEFPPQTEANRYTFEIPTNREVNYIFMYNTVSQSYDENNNKLNNFVATTITKNGTTYKRYVYNEMRKIGKNKFKIIW